MSLPRIATREEWLEARKELLANEDIIAAQDKQNVQLDRQQAMVEKMGDFLENLWDNPKEAMRSFFKDMMKRLLEAILKAAILGDKLGGAGGFGGQWSILRGRGATAPPPDQGE